ncbi:Putative transport protein YdiK [Candidatus Hartigia pinicola]|nr:Putative transport protein YdiK [Candidatus Hartigia pinicola]
MEKLQKQFDLPKFIFGFSFIILMITVCFWVLHPFILGFVWAGMIVIATWPLLLRIEIRLWNKRWLSTLIMVSLILLLFVIPLGLLIGSVIQNSAPFIELVKSTNSVYLPDLEWLNSIPLIGEKSYYAWHKLIASGGNALLAKVQPYFGQAVAWCIAQAINAGRFMFHLMLMLLFSGLLYLKGEFVILGIRHFAVRLAGIRGDAAVILAAQSIRAVALGVVVTALIQAILGGIGLALSGLHYPAILTILLFICCVAQLGPLLIMASSVIWLFWIGNTIWAIILALWTAIIVTMDGVLRPWLIKMGADLPMVLILFGVIGGILSFGMIGLFIGPVVLAVSYILFKAWMNEVSVPDESLEETQRFLKEEFMIKK